MGLMSNLTCVGTLTVALPTLQLQASSYGAKNVYI
ncbi:uncharacterized protein G2W53_033362 [Senna tora]|uniref:Uncharacterized protein n=1 Tax=Senna tora TaxID=362788 RepID=A0A834T137_9FABA|nr:uncharacterized protein G2W53_033362 [Senna tora]